VPLHTLRADIDYGFREARTGSAGWCQVWIYKGDNPAVQAPSDDKVIRKPRWPSVRPPVSPVSPQGRLLGRSQEDRRARDRGCSSREGGRSRIERLLAEEEEIERRIHESTRPRTSAGTRTDPSC